MSLLINKCGLGHRTVQGVEYGGRGRSGMGAGKRFLQEKMMQPLVIENFMRVIRAHDMNFGKKLAKYNFSPQ
jgi:hypothetical protein